MLGDYRSSVVVSVDRVPFDVAAFAHSCFDGTVGNLPYGVHYLVWQSGTYALTLVYGRGVDLSGSGIDYSEADAITVSWSGAMDDISSYRVTSSANAVGSVSPSDGLIWSDMPGYPQLTNRREGDFQHAEVVVAAVGMLLLAYRRFNDSIHGRR